ncbi:MAG: hypothetical protein J6W03_05535 [Bacteroidaceae bacterium]|nr:hypothetical protein [Bacteroidaceae bacterium]
MAETVIDNFEELQEVEQEQAETQEPSEEQDLSQEQQQVSNKEKLMRSLVSDDDEVDELTVASVRQMLDAAPRWFLSQWKMLLLVLAGIFLYITNGYQAQVEMMKETELEAELKDWRYRSITRVSELTQLCRQSQLEQMLRNQGDSTLTPSKVAPFVISVKE